MCIIIFFCTAFEELEVRKRHEGEPNDWALELDQIDNDIRTFAPLLAKDLLSGFITGEERVLYRKPTIFV